MIPIIYSDRSITITRDFISRPGRDPETIPIGQISEVRVTRKLTGDYSAGAVLFFIIGILTVVFVIGWIFLALGVGAIVSKKYSYSLQAVIRGKSITLLTGTEGRLKSLARTISGLSLSRNVLAATA